MTTLLDTNILTRAAQAHHPSYQAAVDSVAMLHGQGERFCLVPQSLYEFWVVATRPVSENGLGWTVPQAQAKIAGLRSLFFLFNDNQTILPQWERLVTKYQVAGKNAHDARLVAAMVVHGIDRILTFNAKDFQRFQEVIALSPQLVLAPTPK